MTAAWARASGAMGLLRSLVALVVGTVLALTGPSAAAAPPGRVASNAPSLLASSLLASGAAVGTSALDQVPAGEGVPPSGPDRSSGPDMGPLVNAGVGFVVMVGMLGVMLLRRRGAKVSRTAR